MTSAIKLETETSVSNFIEKINQKEQEQEIEEIFIVIDSADKEKNKILQIIEKIKNSSLDTSAVIKRASNMASFIPFVCNNIFINPEGIIYPYKNQKNVNSDESIQDVILTIWNKHSINWRELPEKITISEAPKCACTKFTSANLYEHYLRKHPARLKQMQLKNPALFEKLSFAWINEKR